MEENIGTYVLSPVQRSVLKFLEEFISLNGFAPTLKEITNFLGVKSPSTAHFHLIRLEKKGFIERQKGGKIRIISESNKAEKNIIKSENGLLNDSDVIEADEVDSHENTRNGNLVPLCGVIAAGYPVEAIENKTMIEVPSSMTKGWSDVFCLEVSGDSMIEKHICDGDIVVIAKQEYAESGAVVVALLEDGSATLKTYKKLRDGRVMLMPANSSMKPITLDSVSIQGKAIGILRQFF